MARDRPVTWRQLPPLGEPRRLRDVPAREWTQLAALVVLYVGFFVGVPWLNSVISAERELHQIQQQDFTERPQEGSP